MRIEGSMNHPAAAPSDGANPQAALKGQPAASRPAGGDAAAFVSTADAFVQQAKACGDFNAQAVAEARQLLLAGKLDTPQALDRLAERLMNLGTA